MRPQFSPRVLVRFSGRHRHLPAIGANLIAGLLPPCNGFRRFNVTTLRLGGGTTPVRQGQHLHVISPLVSLDLQQVALPNAGSRSCTVTVNLYMTASHRRRGQGASFEKARIPEPAIDSHNFRLFHRHASVAVANDVLIYFAAFRIPEQSRV